MSKTFGCEDVGGDWCPWRMFVNEGEEDLIVEATLKHAEKYHPEFAADPTNEAQIRAKIANLLQQSKYYEQKIEFKDIVEPKVDIDKDSLPGIA
jgi:predicted small metal-binding protein